MIVSELIDLLSDLDQDAEVRVCDWYEGYSEPKVLKRILFIARGQTHVEIGHEQTGPAVLLEPDPLNPTTSSFLMPKGKNDA